MDFVVSRHSKGLTYHESADKARVCYCRNSGSERTISPEVLLAAKCSGSYLLESYKLAGMELPRSEVNKRRVMAVWNTYTQKPPLSNQLLLLLCVEKTLLR